LPSRFHFHGHAIGAGGRLTRPFCENIEVQAAAALPEIGGYGASSSTAFRHRHVLHFDLAHSEVTGGLSAEDKDKPVFVTTLRSIVERLNILGRVTADRVVANLVSIHDGDENGEPSFKFEGSHFVNLRIDGIPVDVDLAVDLLDRHHTHELARGAYQKDKDFRGFFDAATLKSKLEKAPSRIRQWFRKPAADDSQMPHTNGVTSLSLVRGVKIDSPKLECWGNVIHLPDFGTIHLADLQLQKHRRRLVMIRVNLGSPVDGDLEVGAVDGNGTPY
jgi:hypothetical protein